ncbi:hypothetical protein [Reyranella sp.]|uniref:hypothetical protein n=1 Tax=Reyranella sp. TaxID=1929291 RepID=UPI003BADB001
MSDAIADCGALLDSVLPLARQLLTELGRFSPFGAGMRPDGQVVQIGVYHEGDPMRPTEMIALLKGAFGASARAGEYKATAVACDAWVTFPVTGERTDAITVSLEHRDDYAIKVVVPYRLDAGELIVGTAYTEEEEAEIFPAR